MNEGLLALLAFLQGLIGPEEIHLEATESTELEQLLDGAGIPRWDQQLLLLHQIVKVRRRRNDGTESLLRNIGLSMPLEIRDRVEINVAFPAYVADRQTYATEAKDYAVQSREVDPTDVDRFLSTAVEMMVGRQAVIFTADDPNPTRDLQTFIERIGTGYGDRPLRDIHIISHAYWNSDLLMVPTSTQGNSDITWESIEEAGPRAFLIPDRYLDLDYRVAANRPPRIIVHGCEFGKARPLLEKLRNAMSSECTMYAPMHFYGTQNMNGTDNFEYMCQAFWVMSAIELDRAAVIRELKRMRAVDVWGDRVPDARWASLLPAEPWGTPAGQLVDQVLDVVIPPGKRANGSDRPSFKGKARVGGLYVYAIDIVLDVEATVAERDFHADKPRAIKDAIRAVSDPANNLHRAHKFPFWIRAGFPTADQFVDGFHWERSRWDLPRTIHATARGFRYGVLMPIKQRVTPSRQYVKSKLLVNYYASNSASPSPEDLPLTDSKFWASFP